MGFASALDGYFVHVRCHPCLVTGVTTQMTWSWQILSTVSFVDDRTATIFCLENLKPQMSGQEGARQNLKTGWRQGCIPSLISSTCCFRTTRNVREISQIQPEFAVILQELLHASQFLICLSGYFPRIVMH